MLGEPRGTGPRLRVFLEALGRVGGVLGCLKIWLGRGGDGVGFLYLLKVSMAGMPCSVIAGFFTTFRIRCP